MEWIHDEYSVVEKHAQTMLQLVKFGIDWKCGELEQIVNIPVTQIVEEITEVNIPVTQVVEEIAEVSKSRLSGGTSRIFTLRKSKCFLDELV